MYSIYLETEAEKDLRKIPSFISSRIYTKIKELSNNPHAGNCRKLKSTENFWRLRIGNYRVIYEIIDSSKRINIYRIRHRKDAYR